MLKSMWQQMRNELTFHWQLTVKENLCEVGTPARWNTFRIDGRAIFLVYFLSFLWRVYSLNITHEYSTIINNSYLFSFWVQKKIIRKKSLRFYKLRRNGTQLPSHQHSETKNLFSCQKWRQQFYCEKLRIIIKTFVNRNGNETLS